MERLRNRELRGLVEFLMDGYGVGDLDAFAQHLLRALPRVVPCASVSYNEINTRLRRITWIAEPDDATRFPGCETIVSQHIADHPIVARSLSTGEAEWARLSDFMTRRELANTPLYHDFYRRVNVHHQLGISYPTRNAASMAIALNRDIKDFSDRERLLLNVLRPHLRRAYEQAEALTVAKTQLTALKRGIEAAGLGVLALRSDGRIAFVTEAARRWLQSYCAWDAANLAPPVVITEWMQAQKVDYSMPTEIPAPPRPLILTRQDRTLTVRMMRDGGQDLLVMKETARGFPTEALKARGLTHREADVLRWVAEGKSSPEIAVILSISLRTVHHHVESIYRKLGVETRTAAARLATELADLVLHDEGEVDETSS
jgi:DNA-binding CsgD family transcriptional regulator